MEVWRRIVLSYQLDSLPPSILSQSFVLLSISPSVQKLKLAPRVVVGTGCWARPRISIPLYSTEQLKKHAKTNPNPKLLILTLVLYCTRVWKYAARPLQCRVRFLVDGGHSPRGRPLSCNASFCCKQARFLIVVAAAERAGLVGGTDCRRPASVICDACAPLRPSRCLCRAARARHPPGRRCWRWPLRSLIHRPHSDDSPRRSSRIHPTDGRTDDSRARATSRVLINGLVSCARSTTTAASGAAVLHVSLCLCLSLQCVRVLPAIIVHLLAAGPSLLLLLLSDLVLLLASFALPQFFLSSGDFVAGVHLQPYFWPSPSGVLHSSDTCFPPALILGMCVSFSVIQNRV